jgi:alpha-1,3-rhamnosyl/mannosyltransferase
VSKSLQVLFNAESLRPPLTGVGRYSFHLLGELLRSSGVDRVHTFTGARWQDGHRQLQETRALMESQSGAGNRAGLSSLLSSAREALGVLPGARSTYETLKRRRFARHAATVRGAVYHETNYVLRPYAGPSVVTVHDLSHILYPHYHTTRNVQYLGKHLPESIERADRIIAVSNVVREQIIENFPAAKDKVCTVYEGADSAYRPRTEPECVDVLDRHGLLYQRYVLLVATLEPRKGIDLLLRAWKQLPQAQAQQCPLVLVGASGWRNNEIHAMLGPLVERGLVRRLGYVPERELPVLFSAASVFVYPSVYEGFGLPVLEAMHSAVPVICRAGTSMAEFAAGNCLLLDTDTSDELVALLSELLQNDLLREEWGRRGLRQSQEFSWQRCARETQDIYRSLLP